MVLHGVGVTKGSGSNGTFDLDYRRLFLAGYFTLSAQNFGGFRGVGLRRRWCRRVVGKRGARKKERLRWRSERG